MTLTPFLAIGGVLALYALGVGVALWLTDRGGVAETQVKSGYHPVSPAPAGDAGSRERLDRPAATPPPYRPRHRRPPAWRRAAGRVLRGWRGLRLRTGTLLAAPGPALTAEDQETVTWLREVAHPLPLTALGLVAAAVLEWMITQARQADPYPWLAPAWADDTGTFTAICGVT